MSTLRIDFLSCFFRWTAPIRSWLPSFWGWGCDDWCPLGALRPSLSWHFRHVCTIIPHNNLIIEGNIGSSAFLIIHDGGGEGQGFFFSLRREILLTDVKGLSGISIWAFMKNGAKMGHPYDEKALECAIMLSSWTSVDNKDSQSTLCRASDSALIMGENYSGT